MERYKLSGCRELDAEVVLCLPLILNTNNAQNVIMQSAACCSQQVLICSCCLFMVDFFFVPKSFLCRNSMCLSSGAIGIEPVSFFWRAGILTNLMLILFEKYNLDCWLSPVTDALRGFGWNFVCRKILVWKLTLSFVAVTGRSGVSSPCSPACFKRAGTSPEQIAMSTIFLNLSKSANRGASGSREILLPMKLESHTRCRTRSVHICSYFNASV